MRKVSKHSQGDAWRSCELSWSWRNYSRAKGLRKKQTGMGSANITPVWMDLGRDPCLFLQLGNFTLGNLLCQPVHLKAWSTQLGSWHWCLFSDGISVNTGCRSARWSLRDRVQPLVCGSCHSASPAGLQSTCRSKWHRDIPSATVLPHGMSSHHHNTSLHGDHTWILLFHFRDMCSSSSGHSLPDDPTSLQSCNSHHCHGTI